MGRSIAALGYHGWLSYLSSSVWPYFIGWTAVRYHRTKGLKSFPQVEKLLGDNKETIFVIGTDSGGPYYRVRESIIHLAIASNRPLVAVRHFASKTFKVKHHKIPLPFTTITTALSRPYFCDIDSKSIETMRKELQSIMDNLYDKASFI